MSSVVSATAQLALLSPDEFVSTICGVLVARPDGASLRGQLAAALNSPPSGPPPGAGRGGQPAVAVSHVGLVPVLPHGGGRPMATRSGPPGGPPLDGGWGKGAGRGVVAMPPPGAGLASSQGQAFIGHIKSYNEAKGYGFVSCPDVFAQQGRDSWLSKTELERYAHSIGVSDLNSLIGTSVRFNCWVNAKGAPGAKGLAPVDPQTNDTYWATNPMPPAKRPRGGGATPGASGTGGGPITDGLIQMFADAVRDSLGRRVEECNLSVVVNDIRDAGVIDMDALKKKGKMKDLILNLPPGYCKWRADPSQKNGGGILISRADHEPGEVPTAMPLPPESTGPPTAVDEAGGDDEGVSVQCGGCMNLCPVAEGATEVVCSGCGGVLPVPTAEDMAGVAGQAV